jgi:hypothetical protein
MTFKLYRDQIPAVNKMHQNWSQRSEKTLEQLRKMMENEEVDRLELVRIMRYAFGALGTSLTGWMQWVNSPEIMSTFDKDELLKMAKTVTELITKFVEYDIHITEEGTRKGLEKQRELNQQQQQGPRFVI